MSLNSYELIACEYIHVVHPIHVQGSTLPWSQSCSTKVLDFIQFVLHVLEPHSTHVLLVLTVTMQIQLIRYTLCSGLMDSGGRNVRQQGKDLGTSLGAAKTLWVCTAGTCLLE